MPYALRKVAFLRGGDSPAGSCELGEAEKKKQIPFGNDKKEMRGKRERQTRGMTNTKDGSYSVGLKSLKGWVKNSSALRLTSSACSMTVGWPEWGTIQRLACGRFW